MLGIWYISVQANLSSMDNLMILNKLEASFENTFGNMTIIRPLTNVTKFIVDSSGQKGAGTGRIYIYIYNDIHG
jgi:hypothetical protein